jgi:hypothetical protein
LSCKTKLGFGKPEDGSWRCEGQGHATAVEIARAIAPRQNADSIVRILFGVVYLTKSTDRLAGSW